MEQTCTIPYVLSMMKYYHLYNCTSYETSLCVWEREMERGREGERGVLCCINTNRKSLLKHVSTPASYTTTQSYDCHVEWIKLTCLYLQWFWSEWVGTEWHNVLHYSTLRFMFQNHWEQKYYIPRTQRAVTDQMGPRSARSASWDRKEISRDTGRDDWRVTPTSDYKLQGVDCGLLDRCPHS